MNLFFKLQEDERKKEEKDEEEEEKDSVWYIDLAIDGLKLSKDGDGSSAKICAKSFKRFEGGEPQSSTPPIKGQNSPLYVHKKTQKYGKE